MKIVKYQDKYADKVREICLLTGPGDAISNKKVGDYILSTYCNYYIEKEKDNCFVLVDDDDICRGYILCCKNLKDYMRESKNYLLPLKQIGFVNWMECHLEMVGHYLFIKNYPAHLHINLEEGYRGTGAGSEMVNTLLKHLEEEKVKGITLICDWQNVNARRFYGRLGFKNGLNFFNRSLLMKRKIK